MLLPPKMRAALEEDGVEVGSAEVLHEAQIPVLAGEGAHAYFLTPASEFFGLPRDRAGYVLDAFERFGLDGGRALWTALKGSGVFRSEQRAAVVLDHLLRDGNAGYAIRDLESPERRLQHHVSAATHRALRIYAARHELTLSDAATLAIAELLARDEMTPTPAHLSK
jgi:hypothetical protein